jgi:hypothetical protein
MPNPLEMRSKEMNYAKYLIKTNRPKAFRNDVLNESLEILKANNANEVSIIKSSLKHGIIQKPDELDPPIDYDFFWVECTAEDANRIANYLFEAEAAAAKNSGGLSPVSSRFAELADIWTTLKDCL